MQQGRLVTQSCGAWEVPACPRRTKSPVHGPRRTSERPEGSHRPRRLRERVSFESAVQGVVQFGGEGADLFGAKRARKRLRKPR